MNPLDARRSRTYAQLHEQGIAIVEVTTPEIFELAQIFFVGLSGIRFLDFNYQEIIQSSPSVNNNVRDYDSTVYPLDVVTVAIVFAIYVPSGQPGPEVVSDPPSDGSFVNITEQKFRVGS